MLDPLKLKLLAVLTGSTKQVLETELESLQKQHELRSTEPSL